MSANPDWDPFADETTPSPEEFTGGEPDKCGEPGCIEQAGHNMGKADIPVNHSYERSGPTVTQEDNWVSFSFVSDTGYDKLQGTVHGDPEYVAKMFNIEDFDGKISTLMKKALKIDGYFKKWAAEERPAGKG